ncbi:28S ribosomal protein S18c, mitochondrial isoform X4 [Rhincodon typus]|nr:28S ribosomal protein S18c, mitochondrial isoform X4 [Rhincodon typus]
MPIKLENPYKEPPRKCILCGVPVDYKNVQKWARDTAADKTQPHFRDHALNEQQLLSQFISPYTGRIFGRHITGLCGKKQKQISKAIKKAQQMGFMSVTFKDPAFLKDPNICDFKLRE